ncbi:MAG: 50S ribosomal protein L10 [bacterium]|nr:50S ribosomal protein L10 [bacterium]
MATQKKIDTVDNLSEKLSRATSLVLVDYRGLKHKQLEELRKLLRAANAELVITKNRLLLRSLGARGEKIRSNLVDTTATLFTFADEVQPLKVLFKYLKTAGIGRTKAGLIGESVLVEKDVIRLSALPGRETLLAQLVVRLNSPIQGLHYALSWNITRFVYALNGVKEKKET